jgi:hypothetical protein
MSAQVFREILFPQASQSECYTHFSSSHCALHKPPICFALSWSYFGVEYKLWSSFLHNLYVIPLLNFFYKQIFSLEPFSQTRSICRHIFPLASETKFHSAWNCMQNYTLKGARTWKYINIETLILNPYIYTQSYLKLHCKKFVILKRNVRVCR